MGAGMDAQEGWRRRRRNYTRRDGKDTEMPAGNVKSRTLGAAALP